jgi:hypothetical protein
MRRPSKREWALLAVVPVLILVAVGAEQGSKDDAAAIAEARPAAKPKSNASRTADAGELDLEQLRREADAKEPGNVFTSKSWYVAPPPPPPPPPPAKVAPTAPPLPFTYLGQYVDAGKPVFFLVKGDVILTVKVGDIIEGNYRVDGIVGSKLGLTYLPLDIKQTLDIGSAG